MMREIDELERITDQHAHADVLPEFSSPVARLIERRCQTLGIAVPLVVRRFQDRAEGPRGPNGAQNKVSRDFYSKDYRELPRDKAAEVDSMRSALVNDNPATGHPYLKRGLTFIEARHLLIEAYREETNKQFPQVIQTALQDFSRGLEKDIEEAAKAGGFFNEYSKADKALRIAVAGPHRAGQNIPITSTLRR